MKKIFKVIRVVIAVILIAIGLIAIFGKEPEVDLSTIEFEQVNIDDLYNELNTNPAAAKEKYKDKWVEIIGRVDVIDSDLKYIGVYSTSSEFNFDNVHSTLKTDDVKEIVKTVSIGDVVTIRGKITDAGEILGYYLDLYEIIK